ncbi:hypothetical protein, partial [Methylibium sp.]|uniref:hypothetical protein n=1 Tax=Methylibium sp. TaxID=2067992 RepID=UPI0025F9EBCB
MAPVLRRWDLNGTKTYGLSELATAWQRRPAHVAAMGVRARHRGTQATEFFLLDLQEGLLHKRQDALFFLLEEAYPHGADEAPQRYLRAWALLHAVRVASSGGSPDKLIATVSHGLTQAARETEERSWRDWLGPFGSPADTWETVNDRFNPDSGAHGRRDVEPRHRPFTRAAER